MCEAQVLRAEVIGAFIVGGAEPDSADIWEHVQFRHPPEWRLGGPLTPRALLSLVRGRGEVSWEPDHGLQLVYEDGRRLCKVSHYDGHVAVAHAHGDPSLLKVAFG